jgi:hypothetical protein
MGNLLYIVAVMLIIGCCRAFLHSCWRSYTRLIFNCNLSHLNQNEESLSEKRGISSRGIVQIFYEQKTAGENV